MCGNLVPNKATEAHAIDIRSRDSKQRNSTAMKRGQTEREAAEEKLCFGATPEAKRRRGSACERTAELETTTAVSPGSDDPPFSRPVAERMVGKYENSYAPLFPTLSHNLFIKKHLSLIN
jgi:hypothetical protein